MNRILIAIFLSFFASITVAATSAEIASCKARVNASYDTNCTYQSKEDGVSTVFNHPDSLCAAGYTKAMARCDAGYMVVYHLSQNEAYHGTLEEHFPSLIRNPYYNVKEAIRLSISSVPGKSFIKRCYWQPEYNLKGFTSIDSLCGTEPETPFVLTRYLQVNGSWYTFYYPQKPHVMGFSYADTAATVPVYNCRGTYRTLYVATLKYMHFLSLNPVCDGYTNLGIIGYGLPFSTAP